MNAKRHSFMHYGQRPGERGNAMIYVIIVIALFAALTFLMSRQSDTGESGAVTTEKVNINATTIMQAAATAQQAIEQMTYTGAALGALDFILPSDPDFETEPPSNSLKVFHPEGGGVTIPRLPPDAMADAATTPAPGFYIGRFNNVEWSYPDALSNPIEDVVIVAYKISRPVCERINYQLTGDPVIPVLAKPAREVFIDEDPHHGGANSDFMTADCTGRSCEGIPALCVKDSALDLWAFYSLVLARPAP